MLNTKDIKENFLVLDPKTKSELLTELIGIYLDEIKGEEQKLIFQAENWINLLNTKIKNNNSTNSISPIYKKRQNTTKTAFKNIQTFGDDLNSLNYFKSRMEHNDEVDLLELVTCEDEFLIASGSKDRTIKIWSPITGENIFTSEVQKRELYSIINIEGNNLIATTYENDETLKLWNLKGKRLFKSIETGHSGSVNILNCTHNVRKMIFSYGQYDNFIKYWDGSSGDFLKEYNNENKLFSLIKINKNDMKDKLLIAFGTYSIIKIWNVEDEEIFHTFKLGNYNSIILKNIIVSDNNLLLSGGEFGEILIYDIDNLNLFRTLKGYRNQGIISPLLFLDNKFILSCSVYNEGKIQIWNIFDEEYVEEINTNINKVEIKSIIDISIKGNNTIAVILNGEKTILLFDVDTREVCAKLDRHIDKVTSIIKIPNNFNRDFIASSSNDKTIQIWDITNFENTFSINDLKYNVKKVFVKENDDSSLKIIIIFEDNFIHVWNYNCVLNQFTITNIIETKFQISDFIIINKDKDFVAIYNSNKLKIFNLENSEYFNFDGDYFHKLLSIKTLEREMLISLKYNLIKLWDWKDGKCIHSIVNLEERPSIKQVITVSNLKRNLFVVATYSNFLFVLNADEGSLILEIDCNKYIDKICEIEIKGKSLFASLNNSEDKVQIWNAEDGKCVGDIQFNGCQLQFMNYFDNLNFLVLGNLNGFIHFFNSDTFQEIKRFNPGEETTIHSLDFIKFAKKEILIGKFEDCIKLYDAMNFKCLGEIKKNNEALSDYYASPNLIENEKQIMILGWKYGVIKVNLISFLKRVETERGYKNYLCHGPAFNF